MPHIISKNKVRYTTEEVMAFKKSWPASSLQDRSYWFEFDDIGDLVDTDVPEQDDGPAALSLSQAAKEYLDDNPNERPNDPVLATVSSRQP
jgi:hypothetical protein